MPYNLGKPPMVGVAILGLLGSVLGSVAARRSRIDNLSPMIEYQPPLVGHKTFGDGKKLQYAPNTAPTAWNTSFLDFEYRTWQIRDKSEEHFTWATTGDGSAPSLKLSFVGTGITLYGPRFKPTELVGEGSAELQVDGNDQWSDYCKEVNDEYLMVCEVVDLSFGRHTATLTLRTGSFAISHFEVETGADVRTTAPVLGDSSTSKAGANGRSNISPPTRTSPVSKIMNPDIRCFLTLTPQR